jgi:hypothetical protein
LRAHELFVGALEELQHSGGDMPSTSPSGAAKREFWPKKTKASDARNDENDNTLAGGCRWGVRRLLLSMNEEQVISLTINDN